MWTSKPMREFLGLGWVDNVFIFKGSLFPRRWSPVCVVVADSNASLLQHAEDVGDKIYVCEHQHVPKKRHSYIY